MSYVICIKVLHIIILYVLPTLVYAHAVDARYITMLFVVWQFGRKSLSQLLDKLLRLEFVSYVCHSL